MKKIICFTLVLICFSTNYIFAQVGFSPRKLIDSCSLHGMIDYHFADMDGDGDADFLYLTSDEVAWLEHTTDHQLQVKHTVSTNNFLNSICLVDVDGDNDADIAGKVKDGGSLVCFYNLTNGVYESVPFALNNGLLAADGTGKIRSVDLNLDGRTDLVYSCYSNQSGQLFWYRNTGGGNFAAMEQLWLEQSKLVRFSVADINSDQKPDILLTTQSFQSNDSTQLVWLKNDGTTHFLEKKLIAKAVSAAYTIASNLDQDNLPEAFSMTVSEPSKLLWFKNNGVNGFGGPLYLDNGTGHLRTLTLGDLDNDGDKELISWTRESTQQNYIQIFTNSGGSFASQPLSLPGKMRLSESAREIVLQDWDYDLKKDLLVITSNAIFFFKNLGNLQFAPPELITHDGPYGLTRLISGDVDHDGHYDLLGLTGRVPGWYKKQQNGMWSNKKLLLPDSSFNYGAFLARLNQGLDRDVVYLNSNVYTYNKVNNMGDIIASGPLFDLSTFGSVSYFADLDYDGDDDLVTNTSSLTSATTKSIFVVENKGNHNFVLLQEITTNAAGFSGINLVDIDGDGKRDITYKDADTGYFWAKSDATGHFGQIKPFDAPAAFKWGDMDGDGDADQVVYQYPEITIKWNDGAGGFLFTTTVNDLFATVPGIPLINLGDIDNDGDDDLLVESVCNFWAENPGDGHFGQLHLLDDVSYNLSFLDIDGDSDLDIVASHNTEIAFYWFENLTLTTAAHGPQAPSHGLILTPNPAISETTLSFHNYKMQFGCVVEMRTLDGKIVTTCNSSGEPVTIQRNLLPAGIYLVTIKDQRTGALLGSQKVIWE